MQDVAERANVSRALVSLVMNDSPQVSETKRRGVLRAAEELGYRPNLMARNLAQRRTNTIGVLVDDLRNPFFGAVVDGIETAAEERGFRILILNGRRSTRREKTAVETLLQFQVEGLALLGPRLSDDELERIGAAVPTVAVASGDALPGVDTVTTDGRLGAKLAVAHLVGLGHTRIMHIDGGANVSSHERRAGYLQAMRAAGLGDLIDVRAGGDDEAGADAALEGVTAGNGGPTAVFAFNDMVAAGVLDRLSSVGATVPGDVSVVGFDNTFIAGLGRLSLTTVHQPSPAMGSMAVDALFERMGGSRADPVRRTLAPELVVRSTTGPPP